VEEMTHTIRLKIAGMTCGGCVRNVENALMAVAGVDEVLVDLQSGTAEVVISDETVTPDQLAMAVKLAGYNAVVLA
jgi:copper chaperone CopZ